MGRGNSLCNQLTPRVMAGHTRMSRNDTRVLAGHMVLAGRMEFPHHKGDTQEGEHCHVTS